MPHASVERAPAHPDPRVAALAARQRGLITTAQLRAGGLGRGAIAVRVELLVVGRHRVRLHGVRCRITSQLDGADRRIVDGVAVTAPARTLLDLAAILPVRDLRWAVEEARVRRLVSPPSVEDVLARSPGRRGARRLRAVLGDLAAAPAVTRSEAERRLHDLVRSARLPAARANVRLAGYEVDLFWPEAALIAEDDGYAFHGTRAAFERDRRRDADLQAAGYRVVRLTWRQITSEPEAVAALLSRLLAAPRR